MDFERVIRALLTDLEDGRVRYGVIGGFALGVLGVPRATADFDLLVHRDDLERLHQILTGLGYERSVRMENVSRYHHPQAAWGAIDLLHAFRSFALAMLERAAPHRIFAGSSAIKVLQPEDLIGLKVQALANDPVREAQERADIEALLGRYGSRLDWGRIREYYRLFDLEAEAGRLEERFRHA